MGSSPRRETNQDMTAVYLRNMEWLFSLAPAAHRIVGSGETHSLATLGILMFLGCFSWALPTDCSPGCSVRWEIAFIIQENSCPWTQLHRLLSEFPPPSIHIDLISLAILRWTCCLSCPCWTAPENPMSHPESLFQVLFFILTCLGRHLSPGSELLTPL